MRHLPYQPNLAHSCERQRGIYANHRLHLEGIRRVQGSNAKPQILAHLT